MPSAAKDWALRALNRRGAVPVPATLAAVAALLALVPVLLVSIPGFVDAPAHLARHHILAMAPFGEPLSGHFSVHWHWIANLGEDIPAALMGRWLGAETATRIVTAAIAPLTVAGIAALSRAAHGRVSGSVILALPLVFHQAWAYGFLNYCLGTALALLTGAWLYSRKKVTAGGQLALAAAAMVVWTAHMASWAILLLLAAGAVLAGPRKPGDLMRALWANAPLLVPLIPLLAWRARAQGSDFSLIYDERLLNKVAVFVSALRGTWMILDLVLVGAVMLSALLALHWAGARQVERRLFTSGVLLAVAATIAPEYLLGSWGTDIRTAPIALMILILSVSPAADPRRERAICAIGAALFLVRLTSITWIWADRSPGLERRLQMLDAVPRGGRLGYVHVQADCDGWRLLPDEKLASYAVLRRDAFVNTLFMVDNARLVTIRDPNLQDRWTSDSQSVRRVCPADRPDAEGLANTLRDMRRDRFDAIWVSGVKAHELPGMPGYDVAHRLPGETMLVRKP